MMENYDPLELFSSKAKELVVNADVASSGNINDIIKVQEASDKSQKNKSILNSWAIQQAEERKLRKIYAVCLITFLSIQLLAMIIFFLFIGLQIIILSDVQFSAFFISIFGEIAALVTFAARFGVQRSSAAL